jgi:hypothetical protein
MEGTLTARGSELFSHEAQPLFRRNRSERSEKKPPLAQKRSSRELTCEELLEEFRESQPDGDPAGEDDTRDVREQPILAKCIALALLDSREKSR